MIEVTITKLHIGAGKNDIDISCTRYIGWHDGLCGSSRGESGLNGQTVVRPVHARKEDIRNARSRPAPPVHAVCLCAGACVYCVGVFTSSDRGRKVSPTRHAGSREDPRPQICHNSPVSGAYLHPVHRHAVYSAGYSVSQK